MKRRRKISGSLRYELIAGLLAVILFSGGITYLSVLIGSKSSFDNLVKENDLETARTYARTLASYYAGEGSWDHVSDSAEQLSRIPVPRDERHHDRDGIPLVLTDPDGNVVYSGIDPTGEDGDSPEFLETEDGEAVVLEGETVGYVFFKSMIFRRYNPQETEFLSSFRISLTLSVLSGFIVALILGSIFASRIIKPLSSLDRAVKAIAEGDRTARVSIDRRDEIGRFAGNFNLMADKLKVTEEARQNLLADISHELRTPVSIIQANLEMIMEGVYTLDESRLESMYRETKILTGLIADLRSISDMDAGLVEHQPELIPFSDLVEGSCSDMQPLFSDKNMVLDIKSLDKVTVLAEEDKLRQV
ncbi:MAG: histidine kinase dimerization/phospho-acceptor domain-containing protein, partial [Spirochaetales bacterium]|nr:histidine kinase dimerization/phospho-acceptor domain-containing protein [Spirochaetales bacterium]